MLKVFRLCYSYINSLNFTWKSAVRLDKKLATVFSSHCMTSRDKVMWHYGCWLCKNVITRKLEFLSSFELICFYMIMCKIIFFSCFVVISNVFTRFINDSVSLRIEPLTVRNCSSWCKVSKTVLINWYYLRSFSGIHPGLIRSGICA